MHSQHGCSVSLNVFLLFLRGAVRQTRARALGALGTLDLHRILDVYLFEDMDSAIDDTDFLDFVDKFCPSEQQQQQRQQPPPPPPPPPTP